MGHTPDAPQPQGLAGGLVLVVGALGASHICAVVVPVAGVLVQVTPQLLAGEAHMSGAHRGGGCTLSHLVLVECRAVLRGSGRHCCCSLSLVHTLPLHRHRLGGIHLHTAPSAASGKASGRCEAQRGGRPRALLPPHLGATDATLAAVMDSLLRGCPVALSCHCLRTTARSGHPGQACSWDTAATGTHSSRRRPDTRIWSPFFTCSATCCARASKAVTVTLGGRRHEASCQEGRAQRPAGRHCAPH